METLGSYFPFQDSKRQKKLRWDSVQHRTGTTRAHKFLSPGRKFKFNIRTICFLKEQVCLCISNHWQLSNFRPSLHCIKIDFSVLKRWSFQFPSPVFDLLGFRLITIFSSLFPFFPKEAREEGKKTSLEKKTRNKTSQVLPFSPFQILDRYPTLSLQTTNVSFLVLISPSELKLLTF